MSEARVLETTDRPVLVHAGPGAGKTTLLVEKLVRLVASGVAPERVLVLTFSRKAAAEVRRRFEEATRRSFGRLWITTFHSFGHALVKRFALAAGVPRSFRLLTGFKEWVLTRDVLALTPLAGDLVRAREHRGLVGEVANAIALLKQERIGPERLLAAADASQDPALLRDLARLYQVYEGELVRRRHFDYRDLIHRALALLEGNAAVRAEVQGWFDHLLLDELQDIDRAQVDLVRALVQGHPLAARTTAVGDPDQSIYRFRGAVPDEAFPRLLEALPGALRLELDRNHRSLPAIRALSRKVLGRPPDAGDDDAPCIDVRTCATSLAEATALARELARLHGQPRVRRAGSYRWRDMAVLCRSVRRDARPLENELSRLGVPYRVVGSSSFYRNPAVSFLVNLILALADDEDDQPLRRVLSSPIPALPELPLARFLDRVTWRGRHAGRYLWYLRFLLEREDPARWPIHRADPETGTAEEEVASEPRSLRPPYFFQLMSEAEKQAFYDFHRQLLLLRWRARKAEDALPSLVAALAVRSGLTGWILRLKETEPREAARHAANLSKLQAMVQDWVEITAAAGGDPPGLIELASHLRQLLEHFAHETEVEAPLEEDQEPEDAVSIMTVHQAKGLEFDLVAVPHLATGHFPSPARPNVVLGQAVSQVLGARDDPEQHAADERRLFYVAVTRARERLLLSWARRYDGDDEESAPSPFLVEALGGTELELLRMVEEQALTPRGALARIALAARSPRVRFTDDEAAAGELTEVVTRDELEIALRRLHARGDDPARAAVEALLERRRALDRGFVLAPEPFARESPRPLGLATSAIELSASRLLDHRDCPRRFYYSKLLHLERPSGVEARVGTAVHEALRAFHDAHPDREELLQPGGRERLAAELVGLLEAAIGAEREALPNEFAYRRALAGARAMVEPYLELLGQEPTRFVAAREAELRFQAAGARMVAKIDRIGADAASLDVAQEALVSDYKTVRTTNPRALSLRKSILEGRELQLVTYYRAFVAAHGRPPAYLGKVFLRHKSDWRPGALEVLLKLTEVEPAKGDPWRGRDGRVWTDRAWIPPSALDEAWGAIERQIAGILDPARTRFDITPSEAVCKSCGFATVCGKEEAGGPDE